MKEEKKIPLTTICARLERAIHADVGMEGLNILIFGFNRKNGLCSATTMRVRLFRDGFEYMKPKELQLFSVYAGYDLSHE